MVGVGGLNNNRSGRKQSKSSAYSGVKTNTPSNLRLSDLTKTKQHQQLYNAPKRARIVRTSTKIEPTVNQKKKHNLSQTQAVVNNKRENKVSESADTQ